MAINENDGCKIAFIKLKDNSLYLKEDSHVFILFLFLVTLLFTLSVSESDSLCILVGFRYPRKLLKFDKSFE